MSLDTNSASSEANNQSGANDLRNMPVLKNLWMIAQGLVVVAAYFYVLGYVAFTARLYKTTAITSVNVNPQQYLTWGILTALYFVIHFQYWGPTALYILALWAGSLLEIAASEKKLRPLNALTTTWRTLTGTAFGYLLAFIIAISMLVAANSPETLFVSSTSPSNVRRIALIFKDDVNQADWRLTFVSARRTATVKFLDEFNDAILVRDETTGVIIEVKNDMLAGIDDESFPPEPYLTATPTATLSSGVTPSTSATP